MGRVTLIPVCVCDLCPFRPNAENNTVRLVDVSVIVTIVNTFAAAQICLPVT